MPKQILRENDKGELYLETIPDAPVSDNPNDVTIGLTGIGGCCVSGYTPPKQVREFEAELQERKKRRAAQYDQEFLDLLVKEGLCRHK